MSSASCLTNRKRVIADATLTKCVYPTNVMVNSKPIYASIGCVVNFTPIQYSKPICGKIHLGKICGAKV